MTERPIIRVQLPGDSVEEFQRAAAAQLSREFFVELDTPPGEHVRIEAPFKSGSIAVRAEAVTKVATRDGRVGALIRLIKLEPGSYGVSLPPAAAWSAPEAVSELQRKPDAPAIARTPTPVPKPAIARTTTPHVVRRVVEVVEVDDPAAEFGDKASITKSSPVSADLAKQLNERPTPPPAPKAPAIIRRQTPVAGIPAIPKPVEKKVAVPPSTPPIDDEWSFDAPTLGPATKPIAKPAAEPEQPPPPPAKGTPAVKTKPSLDDDAAFDDAFGILEDELAVPVEPVPAPPAPVLRSDEITKPVPATRAASEPRISTAPARAASEPKPAPKVDQDEVPTFDPTKSERSEFPRAPAPDEVTKPIPAAELAALAQPARPSSEGVLATARASELAITGTNELDAFAPATSAGLAASTRSTSETLPPRSRIPLLLAVAAVVATAIVVVVLVTRGGGVTDQAPPARPNKTEVDKHLREAASRIADGKLVGRGGDAALDHLLAAKALAPADPQVIAQLRALADTFEKLGDGALAASDLAEAATHYQAALTAEPDRPSARAKLADVESRARGK